MAGGIGTSSDTSLPLVGGYIVELSGGRSMTVFIQLFILL
jgi:hypothetical protein